jgi:hypothetical protein
MVSGIADVFRIVALLPVVELWRRRVGPNRCVAHFRGRGRQCSARSSSARSRLRRLIGAIDGRLPDGGNCYRRALIEMALDPAFAAEPLHFGLIKQGGPKSGHAWLADAPPVSRSYDAEFTI